VRRPRPPAHGRLPTPRKQSARALRSPLALRQYAGRTQDDAHRPALPQPEPGAALLVSGGRCRPRPSPALNVVRHGDSRTRYNEYVLCLKNNDGDNDSCKKYFQFAHSVCPSSWVRLFLRPWLWEKAGDLIENRDRLRSGRRSARTAPLPVSSTPRSKADRLDGDREGGGSRGRR
jgi:hypothetical protein